MPALLRGMLFGLTLAGLAGPVGADDITVTTYYPSPRGVYDRLQAETAYVHGGSGDFNGDGLYLSTDVTRFLNCARGDDEFPYNASAAAACAIADVTGDGNVDMTDGDTILLMLNGLGSIDEARKRAQLMGYSTVRPRLNGNIELIGGTLNDTTEGLTSIVLRPSLDSPGRAGVPSLNVVIGGIPVLPLPGNVCPVGTLPIDDDLDGTAPDLSEAECVPIRLMVTPGGNVGIGTATPDPAYSLSVLGDAAIGGPPGPTSQPVQQRTLYVVGEMEIMRGTTAGPAIFLSDTNWRGYSNAASIFVASDGSLHLDPRARSDLSDADDLILMKNPTLPPGSDANLGLGQVPTTTPSPANSQATGNLDVNDVYLRSKGQWASQAGGGSLGAWQVLSENTVYRASTDGFVSAWINWRVFSPTPCNFSIYTDGANPPATITSHWYDFSNAAMGASLFSPVKNGDYWEVYITDTVCTAEVHWIPL